MVRIRTPDALVQNSLVSINTNLGEVQQTLAGSCLNRQNGSRANSNSFSVTGTGGIPRTPIDESAYSRYGVVSIADLQGGQPITTAPSKPQLPASQQNQKPNILPPIPFAPIATLMPTSEAPLQEADTLSVTSDGRIILGANPLEIAEGVLRKPNMANTGDLVCDR